MEMCHEHTQAVHGEMRNGRKKATVRYLMSRPDPAADASSGIGSGGGSGVVSRVALSAVVLLLLMR